MLMTNVTLLEVRRWSPTTACVSWGRTQLCVSCWQARLQISPPRRTSLGCRTSLHSSSTPILPGKGWGHQAAVNPLVSRFPNLLYSYQPVSVVFQIVRVIVQQLLSFFPSSAAYSYPIATLSRTMNPYTNSILEYVSFTYKVLELNRKIRIKLRVCWQGLSKTAAALAVSVTRTEFNHEDPGTPRRVGAFC